MAEFVEQLKLVLVILIVLWLSYRIYKIVYQRLQRLAQHVPVHRRHEGAGAPLELEGFDDDE